MIDAAHPDFESVPTADDRPTFAYEPATPSQPPFLTIVTTYATDWRLLAETARSLCGQSLQEWEWLVVADASRRDDGRRALGENAHADPRIQFVDDLRAGVAAARSRFVLEVGAGDLLEPTAAEKWLWFLLSHPASAYVDSFRISLPDRRLVAAGAARVPLAPGPRSWVGVVRRERFWSSGPSEGATLPEYLHWSRSVLKEPEVRTRTGRRRRLKREIGELDQIPFRNELAKSGRRLLMIVPWVTTGGADKFSIDLVSQLCQRDWDVTVVTTLGGDNSWLPRIGRLTPDVFALPNLVAPTDYPSLVRYLIGSRQPDVILISNSLFAYAALPYLRRVAGRTPIVDYCHSVVEGWLDGGYPRLSLQGQDCLDLHITSSAALREWMVERGGDPNRIEACYIGTAKDLRTRSPTRVELGLPEDDMVILYPCRITHEKQPGVFGKTLLELRRRDRTFRAIVVGDGPYLKWLRTFARRHGLTDSVSFAGYQSNERVRELMSVADCVFLPSKFEGISAAFYEAMAEGVPVVGADVGGQRELVSPDCGVLVPPGSQDEEVLRYSRVIEALIDDPSSRRKMGEAARARIEAQFTLDRMGDRMDALLDRARALAASSPQPVPTEEQVREATREGVRIASWTSAGSSFGSASWRVRHILFRTLSIVGMPVYRFGMRLGAHWLEPLKDRVFRLLFTRAE